MPAARRFLRTALLPLESQGAGRELAETLIVAGTELATNAVVHARTEFTVRVLLEATLVRLEVSDGSSGVPEPLPATTDATSGRGLAIIAGSGLAWGVQRHPGGKTVWVEAAR
ncbi:MAG: hypothetical protein QOC80_1274 [Frankiaceae bacterium]|nr:hypothetical protein [Frankiaceae bacterium]